MNNLWSLKSYKINCIRKITKKNCNKKDCLYPTDKILIHGIEIDFQYQKLKFENSKYTGICVIKMISNEQSFS